MSMFSKIKKRFGRINFLLVFIVGFLVYITFISDYNYFRVVAYDKEIKELKAEIKACRDSTQSYQTKLARLDSDPETLERIVREEYNMKRENEDLYIVKE